MSIAQHTPAAAEQAREALEAYGRMMYDAGMDAASDFRDRHREGEAKEQDAAEMLDAYLASQSTPPEPSAISDFICRSVAELPDRNSPEDWPEAMLVTHAELRMIVDEALAVSNWGAAPVASTPPPESAGQGRDK